MTLPASGPLTLADIQTEFGGTNPIGMNEYYAGGGLVPAGTSGTYGAVPSSGALSVQNFYGTTAFTPIYIEEVFSTYLYTGTGASQTITNGINASTKGALFWIKCRTSAEGNRLVDTVRGPNLSLESNYSGPQDNDSNRSVTATTSGFTTGPTASSPNTTGEKYVSWTFAEQPKFFDVVTWTGDGTGTRTITHNLQGTVGCVIAKQTNGTGVWIVQHRGLTNAWTAARLFLNTTGAVSAYSNFTNPTNTTIDIDSNLNGSGAQWVAYFFAHNAGGFGLTGTDNVISCGSFTTDASSNASVSLGYEPQWLIIKNASSAESWYMQDSMRGWPLSGTGGLLYANASAAEGASTSLTFINATGFTSNPVQLTPSSTYIYIAIRRGPMKVPTVGTSVYTSSTQDAGTSISVGFPADLWWGNNTDGDGSGNNHIFATRLQGQAWLRTPRTDAQTATSGTIFWDLQNSFKNNQFGGPRVEFLLARAPNFMDVVCYTGTGSARTVTHNLGVTPELMIVKKRSSTGAWNVYTPTTGNTSSLELNTAYQQTTNDGTWNNTSPTSSVFTVGTASATNGSGSTLIAYLFATLAGVSKVGSYTGTGSLQTVNCGFTSGARLILIKRINVDGYDWYLYNSASGISSGNDPYMLMNTDAAQVTGTNYVDTDSTGFKVTAAAPAGLNASGGTYIFLAIA